MNRLVRDKEGEVFSGKVRAVRWRWGDPGDIENRYFVQRSKNIHSLNLSIIVTKKFHSHPSLSHPNRKA